MPTKTDKDDQIDVERLERKLMTMVDKPAGRYVLRLVHYDETKPPGMRATFRTERLDEDAKG